MRLNLNQLTTWYLQEMKLIFEPFSCHNVKGN